jgi:hypothetical protein|tara:strand:+ start:307 stop:486 length:180 start_codon:yes stop_codon:yes gene_type:complete
MIGFGVLDHTLMIYGDITTGIGWATFITDMVGITMAGIIMVGMAITIGITDLGIIQVIM